MALVYPGDSGNGDQETQNNNFNNFPIPPLCRGGNLRLGSNAPAFQYQTQKIIQNQVRVASSMYTMDLGALTVYQAPSKLLGLGVNWNQSSDRAIPHHQTSGGWGVDIKNGSYDRYYNRLMAKRDIRRGPIPKTFGQPIPYNPAFPIKGGKTVKTSIVSGCNCPPERSLREETLIYRTHFSPRMFDPYYSFEVGGYVYARLSDTSPILKAEILNITAPNNNFTVKFVGDGSIATVPYTNIIPYFPCNCNGPPTPVETTTGYIVDGKIAEYCYLLNTITGPNYLQYITNKLIPSL